ncbi:phosphate transport system permease protein [Methanohalophilus levihalophilus]|nr:phosphate transport system permease protein [Methanohalophilus levihalophilus]
MLTVIVITFFVGFVFYTAYPIFAQEGFSFLTGDRWSYTDDVFGIRIFILGSLILTGTTLLMAVPLSLFSAICISEFVSEKVEFVFKSLIELLVGIPSVVYGIFGLFVLENIFQYQIEPFISSTLGFIPIFRDVTPSFGLGLLLASVILTIMILPTVTAISIDAMKAVPYDYREGSYAVGATQWETIRHVVLPAASSGVVSAVILGMMRAIGETMAIVMVFGNAVNVPVSLMDTGFAMTSKILNDIGFYVAQDVPRSALFGIAAVLFAIEIVLVAAARYVGKRGMVIQS